MRPGEFRTETFPPPIKGWVEESAAASTPKDSAVVLDNFVPTLEGARLRGGCIRAAWSGDDTPRIVEAAVQMRTYAAIQYPSPSIVPGIRVALYNNDFTARIANSGATFNAFLPPPDQGHSPRIEFYDFEDESVWQSVPEDDGNIATIVDGSLLSVGTLRVLPRTVTNGTLIPAITAPNYVDGPRIDTLFARETSVSTLFAAVAPDNADGDDGYIALASGDLGAGTPAVSGLTSAFWSTTHISTAGGDYLVGVNGADEGIVNDGLTWKRYWTGTDAAWTALGAAKQAGLHRMHGESAQKMSDVWNFKERLFFIEKGTLNAWYLPVKSIADTESAQITKLPLGALFEKGGSLLFGATYSMDGGDGPDDYCVFATDRGELAIFGGIDPGSATGTDPWRLEGRFEIAPPLNARAHFRLGGDLAILTADGIVSLTEISRSDRVAASSSALTRPIGDAWRRAVQATGHPLPAVLWREKALLLVGVPDQDSRKTAFAMNAETGAWCRFKGWDVRCACVSGGRLYFGTADGRVMEAERGGQDDGMAYRGEWVPKFRDFRDRRRKFANRVLVDFTSVPQSVYAVKALSDFRVNLGDLNPDPIPASGAVPVPGSGSSVSIGTFNWGGSATWGGGAVWGVGVPPEGGGPGGAVWSGGASVNQSLWRGTRGVGRMLSLGLVVTANTQAAPVFDILLAQMRFEAASEF